MKKRRIFVSIVALLLVAMLPVVAFAATHDVSDWDGFKNVFANDTDANVIINLLNDLFGQGVVNTGENQNYTVNGNGFVVADVGYDGAGNVTVNAESGGFGVFGDVTLEQNGDVNGQVAGSANAQVTVNGNVTQTDGYPAVYAGGDSNVTVNGNVTADMAGVVAYDDAQATVNGNVTADGVGVVAPPGVDDETNNAKVTVNGDVTAAGIGVAVGADSEVTVSGNVTGGQVGVYAEDNAKVDVGGNVTGTDATEDKPYAGDGVIAEDTAEVTVGGNVKGGDVPAEAAPEPIGTLPPAAPEAGGDGVVMDNTATVKVAGNVQGGNNAAKNGLAGHGVRIWVLPLTEDGQTPGSLTVNGSVIGGVNSGEDGKDGNSIYYDVAFVLPTVGDVKTAAELNDEVYNGYMYLIDFADSTGVMTSERQAQIDGLKTALNADLSAVLGEPYDFFMDSLPSNLDAETIAALKPIFTQFMKDVYATLFPEGLVYDIPEITVSKLQAVNDAFFGAGSISRYGGGDGYGLMSTQSVQTEKVLESQALADLLGAQVNYFVNVPTVANGKVTADKATAKAGETVTFTAMPDAGYVLSSITVNGKVLSPNADGTYSYVMETGGAEIAVAFAKAEEDTTTKGGVPKTQDGMHLGIAGMLVLLALSGLLLKKRSVTEK